MKRLLPLIGFLVLIVGALWWAARTRLAPDTSPSELSVVATFYPMAEAARQVGGDRVVVATIVPPGGEPHEYEPTPGDIAAAVGANVFVMNGNVDAWADRILPDLRKAGATVVRAQDRLPEIAEDPHVWLDPAREKIIVEAIREGLSQADPAGTAIYTSKAAQYEQELDDLDQAYASGLKNCSTRVVVTSHDALGYLAERYDFRVVPITGLDPEQEPSPRTLAEIADTARAAGVKYVFFETLLSSKIAQTVAHSIGAQLLTFDPVEGLTPDAVLAGKSYLSIMRDNLQALETAMDCT